ncbi:MAG: endonuclease/exonuclease/phosphatase family protein [Haloarculaceae archaeon]
MDSDVARALSYNVRYDEPTDEYDWARRRDAVVDAIRFHRPDVVGLQETLPHQLEDVRAGLPDFEWVSRTRQADEGEGEACPVGHRTARLERLDSGTFWLAETPDQPGSVGWDARLPRIATWVRFRDRDTGGRLVYLNTHLDHEAERARREGARLIRDRLAALRDGAPALVAGDWNCTPGEEPYAILAGRGDTDSPLVPADEAAPRGRFGPTTTRTDFEELLPDRAIDHAFVAGLSVEQCGVAADVVGDGWYPSDHLPLVVDFSVEE